jgi:hypothetical protein
MRKKSKWQKLQDGELKSSLRTGSLSDPAKLIGPRSGRLRRLAKAALRRGDKDGAKIANEQAMYEAMNEPTIKSQDWRAQNEARTADLEAQRNYSRDLQNQLINKLLKRSDSAGVDDPKTDSDGFGPIRRMPAEMPVAVVEENSGARAAWESEGRRMGWM